MFMSSAVTVLMLRENISDAVPCEVDAGHNYSWIRVGQRWTSIVSGDPSKQI